MGKPPDTRKIYDDDIVEAISEEFSDRIRAVPNVGDIIRATNMSIIRRKLTFDQLLSISIGKIDSLNRISRLDIAQLTKVNGIPGNSILPFMNGGPTDQYWNTSENGFYDWIDKAILF